LEHLLSLTSLLCEAYQRGFFHSNRVVIRQLDKHQTVWAINLVPCELDMGILDALDRKTKELLEKKIRSKISPCIQIFELIDFKF